MRFYAPFSFLNLALSPLLFLHLPYYPRTRERVGELQEVKAGLEAGYINGHIIAVGLPLPLLPADYIG